MIQTTLPTNLFDPFSSSYEQSISKSLLKIDSFKSFFIIFKDIINQNNDIHSMLVYIGLITVILFVLFVIFSLMCKCRKMVIDETIRMKKKSIVLTKTRLETESFS